VELCERRPELELIREASHDALRRIELPDVVIIDGDHNYYTVSEELRLIAEKADGSPLPLVFFHDVCWPHARRDAYYVPERIPADARQRMAHDGAIAPGEPGIVETGLSYPWVAEREGGSRNGVLTAIEDFITDREGVRYVSVPAFFGLGVLWSEGAPWAGAVAEIVDPWNENPLLQRLETNRIRHMANSIRADELEGLLRVMLGSRAFTWAEWLSRLNQRGKPMFSRKKVRAVLGDDRIAARSTPEDPTRRGRSRSPRRAS
jgi:hypothetical protein